MSSSSPSALDPHIEQLERSIAACELQLRRLKLDLADARVEQARITENEQDRAQHLALALEGGFPTEWMEEALMVLKEETVHPQQQVRWPLSDREYKRYGRQLIMPEIGLQGQQKLKMVSVLIVGAGGLGCPAAAYLAGAGVRAIGLVDADTVEESNLHRQILHNTEKIGVSKVDSAIDYLRSLNPNVQYKPHNLRLSVENALDIFRDYDIVLDCTDNPATRYLISDICVLLNQPLVSASALKTEGQLMVLNYPPFHPGMPRGGPCYRCIFPTPPPPESVLSCGEGGILGPVVGVMGILQALEAIKLITGDLQPNYEDQWHTPTPKTASPSMLLFSAYSEPQFRSIRMRSRKAGCVACSSPEAADRLMDDIKSGSMDYVQFCGSNDSINALAPSERVSAKDFANLRQSFSNGIGYTLIDVRDKVQFGLCSLDNSINIPFSDISSAGRIVQAGGKPEWIEHVEKEGSQKPLFVVCRFGNDSQLVVRQLKDAGLDLGGSRYVGDIQGGLRAWRREVDPTFPEY